MIVNVTGPGKLQGTASTKRKEVRKAAGNFSEFLTTEETAAPKSSAGIQATGIVGALLALEEEQSATDKPLRRAHRLLDNLEEVRYALLSGGIPEASIRRLQGQIAEERGEVVDPKLLEILEEIDTRAAVELAKLETAREKGE